jgi:hypothetical protein
MPKHLIDALDWNVYDGIGNDGSRKDLYVEGYHIDLDRDGQDDYSQHGTTWIHNKWRAGWDTVYAHLRSYLDERVGGNKVIFFHSVGDSTQHILHANGSGMESWMINNSETIENNFRIYDAWCRKSPEPHINAINPRADWYDTTGYGIFNGKNYFRFLRFGLGFTLMGNGYIYGSAWPQHHACFYYDEYDTQLGYPTSGRHRRSDDTWVRFFDNGVVIVNASQSTRTVTDANLQAYPQYHGPYHRFKGNQDSVWNNGSPFDSVTLVSTTPRPAPEGGNTPRSNVGDAIILLRTPKIVVCDIYVDDGEAGTSPGSDRCTWSSGFVHDDVSHNLHHLAWNNGLTTDKTYASAGYTRGYYNSHQHIASQGTGSDSAVYRPTINVAGWYRIHEWHAWVGPRAANVEATAAPVWIYHAAGRKDTTINQRSSNLRATWNLLGTFWLDKNSRVVLKNGPNAGGTVIADAFKFEYQGRKR